MPVTLSVQPARCFSITMVFPALVRAASMPRIIAVRLKVEQNQLVGIFAEFVLGVGWLERL